MKKIKLFLVTILSVLMCGIFFMCACGESTTILFGNSWYEGNIDNLPDSKDPDDSNGDINDPNLPTYLWNLADLGNVTLHTDLQKEFIDGGDYNSINASGRQELSRPNSTTFEWSASPENEEEIIESDFVQYKLEISATDNFADPWVYETTETTQEVWNLYVATQYYWRVTAEYEGGIKIVSQTSTFTTEAAAPRNLYVSGLTNVRDLGGWETPNGRVKQGLIYRCAGLNEKASTRLRITEKGINTMRNQLKIRTEIDVRLGEDGDVSGEKGGITSSPLGDDIKYCFFPMRWDDSIILTGNSEQIVKIFEVLADENNYPLIFHCNIGTDRTGLIAFLINGLLGVEEDDLYYDYMFSNYGSIGSGRSVSTIQHNYVNMLKEYEGETLADKIENYLVNEALVPKANIDAMRRILSA